MKRKDCLTHATIWMNLEDIMVSEISQLQKDKYRMSPLRVIKFIKTENRMVVARA